MEKRIIAVIPVLMSRDPDGNALQFVSEVESS
jgi:hypothetical protein